jgi:uncharacterized protein (TIGR02284 family)
MAQKTQRTVLNHLIEVCRDAERGFAIAARTVKTPALKRLFYALAEQRREFAQELLPHAECLDGAAVAKGSSLAMLHRAWIRVKGRLAATPDRAVLEEVWRGERASHQGAAGAMSWTRHEYEDIPGTYVFDGKHAHGAYPLNKIATRRRIATTTGSPVSTKT